MTITDILAAADTDSSIFIGNAALILAAVMTIVQISPIKINPWSWIARKIGKAINGELLTRIDQIDTELVKIRSDVARGEVINSRTRILRFGDECLHDKKHTKEHFDNILRDIKNYDNYCSEHPEFENNVTKITAERIEEIYHKCLLTNDFL